MRAGKPEPAATPLRSFRLRLNPDFRKATALLVDGHRVQAIDALADLVVREAARRTSNLRERTRPVRQLRIADVSPHADALDNPLFVLGIVK